MITSKQDALWVLEILFGDSNPRSPDLTEEQYNFVKEMQATIDLTEKRVVKGYAYIPQERVDKSILPEIIARPTHVLPTGHPIVYHASNGILCGECASGYEDDEVERWRIIWREEFRHCDGCGGRIVMLSEYEEEL